MASLAFVVFINDPFTEVILKVYETASYSEANFLLPTEISILNQITLLKHTVRGRLEAVLWIRIRIRVYWLDPDPDSDFRIRIRAFGSESDYTLEMVVCFSIFLSKIRL